MSRVSARLAKVEQHLDSTIFQDVNAWLQPIHQTSKLDANIQARDESTCTWLLKNTTFLQWMTEKRGIFWFHGLMGTGKTVISSFVIQTLCARDDICVAYYYFEFTNPATLSEEALLRSLVVQLAAASPAVVRTFHQKHNNGGLQPQLESLHTTLNDSLSITAKPVFIVIDALDELPLTQRKYLLRYLATFSASSKVPQIHIMITSREDVDIQRTFEEIADFDLGVQGDLVRQDIAAFVDRQLEVKKWELWPRGEIEMMRRVLNERADGQFRMVTCQIDIIQRVNNSRQLRESLYSLPKSLSETYDYILKKIPSDLRIQAHRLFNILSFASYNVSLVELSALLAVELSDEEDSEEFPRFQEANQFHNPLDVINLGTSLLSRVTYDDRTYLQIAHASVKEHFLAQSYGWFSLNEDLAHRTIARCCVTLLLHFRIFDQGMPGEVFYNYSIHNWHVRIPNGPAHTPAATLIRFVFLETRLLLAAFFSLLDLVEIFLNARPWEPGTLSEALVAATRSKRPYPIVLRCCTLLLSTGANVNVLTKSTFPLEVASFAGNLEMVRFLIGKGAHVNQVGGDRGSPLRAAALSGNLELVRYLVEMGAKVNAIWGFYGTALEASARKGHLGIVRFLIEKGGEVNLVGLDFATALQAGASSGNLELVRFLIENGAEVNVVGGYDGTALQAGALSRNLELVHFLVEMGADVNPVGGEYGTALQAGVVSRNPAIVQFLLVRGAEVNSIGGMYGTALKAAASAGELDVVRLLVENGAKVNLVGGFYEGSSKTALDIARNGVSDPGTNTFEEIAEYLESHGAKIWDEVLRPSRPTTLREVEVLSSG
ncbi:ankyrin repeat-containing domain protein [Flagelloscypha sp. PMI_526]|nr:ankyrin repeat-containing domain protein [Flagelloscypha sp. PMI_526]